MAKMTKRYPYVYQALGYLMRERDIKVIDKSLIYEYDYYLKQYVYSKIWEGIPNGEREVLNAMCDTENIFCIP